MNARLRSGHPSARVVALGSPDTARGNRRRKLSPDQKLTSAKIGDLPGLRTKSLNYNVGQRNPIGCTTPLGPPMAQPKKVIESYRSQGCSFSNCCVCGYCWIFARALRFLRLSISTGDPDYDSSNVLLYRYAICFCKGWP